MLEFTQVKYVYVHNFSAFDGIFLLKHLNAYLEGGPCKVEPLIYNNLLITLKFRIYQNNKKKLELLYLKILI